MSVASELFPHHLLLVGLRRPLIYRLTYDVGCVKFGIVRALLLEIGLPDDFHAAYLFSLFYFCFNLLTLQAEDKDGIMSTMTHIRDVRKKAPMVTGLFGPLKDTVVLLKSRGIPIDLPPVNDQASLCFCESV